MVLFYSGITPNGPSNASQSLGGFVSNTQILNNSIHNLFSTITRSSLQNNVVETKLIVLKNLLPAAINSLRVWTVVESELFLLKIGVVAPVYDPTCERYYFEQILSPEQLPYQATLTQHEGEVNSDTIGTVESNSVIGIWVSRQFTPETLLEFSTGNEQSCSDDDIAKLEALLENLNSEEKFDLILDWV